MANSLLGALDIVACSDPGLVRSQNEDSVMADAGQGLVILADGMGGYNAGEVASKMAVATDAPLSTSQSSTAAVR